MLARPALALVLVLGLVAAGCGTSRDPDGLPVRDVADGAAPDAVVAADAGPTDDGGPDAGAPDAGALPDAATDATSKDATAGDATAGDAAAADGAARDVGPDGGPDAAGTDGGPDAADAVTPADVPLEVVTPGELPTALPFVYERPAAGAPLAAAEVTEFTREITGFWKDVQYFRWVRFTSHGIDPSNTEGWFDYALWWQDTTAEKQGDTVTFRHVGPADNLTLRTCKVLNNALAGYLMTGDPDMRWVATQYMKGLVALSRAMEWGHEDPVVPYLQARAIFTRNHEYTMEGGRRVVIDYDPVKHRTDGWNASTVHNPENPWWGDIWLRNQRSKDDVPHMFRSVPMLLRAAREAPDEDVRAAAEQALEYLGGFARDIVASGYQIRTKDEDAVPFVPLLDNGVVKDLASLVLYEPLDRNAECSAKLATAFVGWGQGLANHCGDGRGTIYELIATEGHYFNYAIVRFFHIAAVYNALTLGDTERAQALLAGLATRAERILHDETMPNRDEPVWWSDAAAFLLAAAAAGLPLTAEEARLVRDQYRLSAEHYRGFAYWDPWDAAVPDGPFGYMPDRGVAVRPTELTYLLEYCYSPLRNPATAPLVDCEVVADPSRWGL